MARDVQGICTHVKYFKGGKSGLKSVLESYYSIDYIEIIVKFKLVLRWLYIENISKYCEFKISCEIRLLMTKILVRFLWDSCEILVRFLWDSCEIARIIKRKS